MAKGEKDAGVGTLVVHAGERMPAAAGMPVSPPVYATTTFTYASMGEMEEVFSGARPGYIYTRHGNPSLGALAESVRALEGGAGAFTFASGMAAMHAVMLACGLAPGSVVLASQDIYGATTSMLEQVFGPFGVRTETADFMDAEALSARVDELRPRALVAETISNPLLKVCDLELCVRVAHKAGAKFVADNTFATPFLCRPIPFGADFVVHSATKYLNGHGDATGGLVVARDTSDLAPLDSAMRLAGGVLGVWEAHEILRGIKTLAVRMERHCANARGLAEHLTGHPRISRVHHPTLGGERQKELAGRVLRSPHGGALVTLGLREDTREAAFRFMDALKLCVRSTSLGDVFTGVSHPATSSHRNLTPERRRELGITDDIVRISVGIEDLEDIIDDIDRALMS